MARPRIHPDGESPSATERSRLARKALRARGGKVLQIMLEPEDAARLARVRADHALPSDAAAIAYALAVAAKRR